jgi:AAA domain, putative AbiEii toxin, Type IV TA system
MPVEYQSEVRQSTIQGLLEKTSNKNFGKFIHRLELKKIRSFTDEIIDFDFPVTAIIGTNGGGKSTILGACGIIYSSIQPRSFFARGGALDKGMQDWELNYELIDKSMSPRETLKRTANYKRFKWNRNPLSRSVLVFGVSRTVPPIEKSSFSKYASNSLTFKPEQIVQLPADVAQYIGRILGKDVSNFNSVKVSASGDINLLAGNTAGGVQYSEFHFGAGESSIIRMVTQIESLPENSLVLIEEIENGLHPVATVRMVEYLINVADRKKIQTVFTTHSNDALKPLPSKAIWASVNGKLFQGKLDIHSLRAITGQIESKLAIFVEDKFAKLWIESALAHTDNIASDHIEVHGMEGDGAAVSIHKYHNLNPLIAQKVPSACFIDGDSKQSTSDTDLIFRLPGTASPETYIFYSVIEKLEEAKGILAVSLHKRFEDADNIARIIEEIKVTNFDPHLLFAQIGKRLGLIPEEVVIRAFLSTWNQFYEAERQAIIAKVLPLLPEEKSSVTQ